DLVNCASPGYLAEHGTPASVDDLGNGHWLVGYAASGSGRALPWEHLAADGNLHTLALPAQVVVDNAESYIACCLAGLGLVQVPRQAGAGRTAGPRLYPHRRPRSRRLTAFVDRFQALIAPHLSSPATGR